MHGTIMLFLFRPPLFVGFRKRDHASADRAPDVAFPRLNMFSYWLFSSSVASLRGALSFLVPSGAADFGWFATSR